MQIVGLFGFLNLDGYKEVNKVLGEITMIMFGRISNPFLALDLQSSNFLTNLSPTAQYYEYFKMLNKEGLSVALDEQRVDYLAWNRIGLIGWAYLLTSLLLALVLIVLKMKISNFNKKGK